MRKISDFLYAIRESGILAAVILAIRYIFKIDYRKTLTMREMRNGLIWNITPETLERHKTYRKNNISKAKSPKSIHWILPPLAASSGGHRTITRMVSHLISKGYENTIWVSDTKDSSSLANDMQSIFGLSGCRIAPLLHPENIEADVLIATDRWTVFPAALSEKALKKYYFIQDFEPLFYEAGSASVLTDCTYKLGFHAITAGKWLAQVLKHHHQIHADSFDLACDHEIYHTNDRITSTQETVIFYARDTTPRRCAELGILALEQFKKKMPEAHVILFGFDPKNMRLPFKAETHGIITPKQIAALYARSTVGLSLSATNHSLIPNEMMACGLPVVELNLWNNTIIYPKNTVSFADPHPTMIANSLFDLLKNDNEREKRIRNSLAYVRDLSWKKSAEKVEKIILENFKKNI